MKPPVKPNVLAARPKWRVVDVFIRYRHLLGPLHKEATKVVRDICDCRTAKLGGHVRQCDRADCGHEEISYNSCRNRHCPSCQFIARAEWVQARKDELLPVEYFHVVFTLPDTLNALCLQNKKVMYDLLFRAASETLKEVGARRLQAEVGFIAILHTWGQNLMEHPHLHVVMPNGGLKQGDEARQGDEWVRGSKGYLFPVKVLSEVFRGKFLSFLRESFKNKELKFVGRCEALAREGRFNQLLDHAWKKNWVVYAKEPFAGPTQVVQYLGNYTHRIAISDHRIIKIENDHVHFRYRDYADRNKNKVMILHVKEFMRRILLHVLPARFVRIRHYGFLGNRGRKERIERLKALLDPDHKPAPVPSPCEDIQTPDWKEKYKQLTGVDLSVCRKCGAGRMFEVRTIESLYDRRKRGQRPIRRDTS